MNSTVEKKRNHVLVATGSIQTAFRSGSDDAAAEQIAMLQDQYLMWQKECERLRNENAALRSLLERCYITGHRRGWEEGESSLEVLSAVNDILCEKVHGWCEREVFRKNDEAG